MTRSTRPRGGGGRHSPGGGAALLYLPGRSAGCSATMKTRTPASPSCARPYNPRFVRLRELRRRSLDRRGQAARAEVEHLRLRCADREVCRPCRIGHRRSDQGRAHSASERSFHRGAPDTTEAMVANGRRRTRRPACPRRMGGWTTKARSDWIERHTELSFQATRKQPFSAPTCAEWFPSDVWCVN